MAATFSTRKATAADPTALAADPDGAAFFITERPPKGRDVAATESSASVRFKWKTILALILVCAAILLEQNWLWGVLFLFWSVLSVRSGETFFVERLSRRRDPVLYWLVVAIWIGLSLYLIIADFGFLVS